MSKQRSCIICHCTDSQACANGCYWLDTKNGEDRCSRCKGKKIIKKSNVECSFKVDAVTVCTFYEVTLLTSTSRLHGFINTIDGEIVSYLKFKKPLSIIQKRLIREHFTSFLKDQKKKHNG